MDVLDYRCKKCRKMKSDHRSVKGGIYHYYCEDGEEATFNKHPSSGRLSQSFLPDEVEFIDNIMAQLLRGSSVYVSASKAQTVQGLFKKFRGMKTKLEKTQKPLLKVS